MGAVSVFTSEELPSPTFSEMLTSFRDVVAWFALLRMSLRKSFTCVFVAFI